MKIAFNPVDSGQLAASIKAAEPKAKDNSFKNAINDASKNKAKAETKETDNKTNVQDKNTDSKDTPVKKPQKDTGKNEKETPAVDVLKQTEAEAALNAAMLSGKITLFDLMAEVKVDDNTINLQTEAGQQAAETVLPQQAETKATDNIVANVVEEKTVIKEEGHQNVFMKTVENTSQKQDSSIMPLQQNVKSEEKVQTTKPEEKIVMETQSSSVEEKTATAEKKIDLNPNLTEKTTKSEEKTDSNYQISNSSVGTVESDKKIKVKVGDVIHVNKENVAEKLAEKISIRATGKENEFEVQLEPENLGKIMIKVGMQDGKVAVSVLCSNGKAADILSQNVKELGALIQNNTGNQATVEIKEKQQNDLYFDQQGSHSQNQNGQQEKNTQHQKDQEDVTDFIQQMRLGLFSLAE